MADNSIQIMQEEEGAFFGSVQIADDVIASIAALATIDVEGVSGMAGNITSDVAAMLGGKNLSKGVKLAVNDDELEFTLALNIEYGYSIPEVCERVQDKVRTTVETMTGLTVSAVNIHISGMSTPQTDD